MREEVVICSPPESESYIVIVSPSPTVEAVLDVEVENICRVDPDSRLLLEVEAVEVRDDELVLAFDFPLGGDDIVVVVLFPFTCTVEVEEKVVETAVASAGAGRAMSGGGDGMAYNAVHCRAVLSCWTRLRTNSVAIVGTD
jgi:hypothetical protein